VPGKYIDAEQALAELDQSPVVLKNFQGQDWELFSAMPAKPVFKILQLEASGHAQDEMSVGESLMMLGEMVPHEVLDAWLEGGMTTAQVVVLMNAIIAAYSGSVSEEGEAEGPEKGPTPSSKTGSRSKRTSPANTA